MKSIVELSAEINLYFLSVPSLVESPKAGKGRQSLPQGQAEGDPWAFLCLHLNLALAVTFSVFLSFKL